jgi:ribosomal protein S7
MFRKNFILYNKLLHFIIKKGNKIRAAIILDNVFQQLCLLTKKSFLQVLLCIFYKLNTSIEAKKIYIRKRNHIVPFVISLKRRSYLIVKWLVISVSKNKKNISIAKKLFMELTRLLIKKNSLSLKLKHLNFKKVYLNRSNTHFRW